MFTLQESKQLTDFQNHIDNLSVDLPVCLFYDDDADGLCSAISVQTLLEQKGIQVISYAKHEERKLFSLNFISELVEKGVQAIICVDFEPISWNFLDESQITIFPLPLFIIDHHFNQTAIYDKYPRAIFVHPANSSTSADSSQYCCSKFVYDVCMSIEDISTVEWKILPGIIGDMNIISWPEYVREVAKRNSTPIGDELKSFFESPYGDFSALTAFAAKKGAAAFEECFAHHYLSNTIQESNTLSSKYTAEKNYYDSMLQTWTKYESKLGELRIIELPKRGGMGSALSSIISYLHPEDTFVFLQKDEKNGIYKMSLRSQQSPAHLGEVVRFVTAHFDKSSGGGHKPAAGAACLIKDKEAFLDEIKTEISKSTA